MIGKPPCYKVKCECCEFRHSCANYKPCYTPIWISTPYWNTEGSWCTSTSADGTNITITYNGAGNE